MLRHAETRRSSTCTRPSARASRTALRTVVSDTPARAAMWPTVRVQAPWRRTSADTTARTAVSASVNRAARLGGRAPEAAQRRRLSSDAACSRPRAETALYGLLNGRESPFSLDGFRERRRLGLGDVARRIGLPEQLRHPRKLDTRRRLHGAP